MSLQVVLLFTVMEFVFCVTPGPAVLLASTYGFRNGTRTAFIASLGTETGNTVYMFVSAAGLGALLRASSVAFEIVKWAGAAYLVFLGIRTIWKAGHEAPNDQRPRIINHPYLQALITQFGNPKVIVFYTSLIPQFLDVHRPLWPQYAIMWAIVAAIEVPVLTAYGWLAAQGNRLVHPRFALWRERASGAMLIFVGAVFATVKHA
jgi:homoserine/homoserine lactone efflux protein